MCGAYIYARCSTDKQDEASLEVQIRNCQDLAKRDGIVVPEENIFTDYGFSGQEHATPNRKGYLALLDAWDHKKIKRIYANEISRLTRDDVEASKFKRRIEKTKVILITRDGVDSRNPNWHMTWGIIMAMASQEVRSLAIRVVDGMKGVLDGGGMIAPPPFGFVPDPNRKTSGDKRQGSRWVVHPTNAQIVHQMFEQRRSGQSHTAIALALNKKGVPSPRLGHDGLPGKWRQATVHRLLSNTIYRGVFVYRGSSFIRAQEKDSEIKSTAIEYSRPEFRLVSDEMWFACNPPKRQRLRAGVTHVLAGLVSCGECGNRISWKATKSGMGGSCPTCENDTRTEAKGRKVGYTSIKAASLALNAALKELISPEVVAEFHTKLRKRLETPKASEEQLLRREIIDIRSRQQRLVTLAQSPNIGLETVAAQLTPINEELKTAERKLEQLSHLHNKITAVDVQKQMKVEIEPLIAKAIAGEPTVHEARVVLRRLIKRFAFVARRKPCVSVFEIVFVPAVASAVATGG